MFGGHPLLESVTIEGLSFAALFAFDQFTSDRLDFCMASLIMANQIANVLTVVGEVPGLNPRLDPLVLLFGNGD